MFPLLPALILLLLVGPANVDKMVANGHLPAGIAAVPRHLDPATDPLVCEFLVPFLLESGSTHGSGALPEGSRIPAQGSRGRISAATPSSLQEGFRATGRSRDGPFQNA